MQKPELEDLKILPKVCEMAEAIDSDEAYNAKKKIYLGADYFQASNIVTEAREFLEAILLNPVNARLSSLQIGVMADLAKEIGNLAPSLETISRLKKEEKQDED